MTTGNNSLNAQPDGWVAPNIALGDFRGQRYPNQFFDISQQYMPPTIKELFRWCTFYFYNSPLIGSSLRKVSRYPITDLIIEDELPSTTQIWEQILIKDLRFKEKLAEINLDYHVYGNAFVSLHMPFTRFLICKSCGHRHIIGQAKWRFDGSNLRFNVECSQCGTNGEALVKDIPHKDRKALRLIRWSPENIHLKYNEYTGRYVYMYAVPVKLRRAIQRGDKDILEDMPLIVLEAVKNRRLIKFDANNIFHLKNPTLAEQDQGWGKPVILHVLKDMYYLYTLRRAQEAIALEHIVPFDLIYPLPNAQQDPFIHTDLAGWRAQIESVVQRHRRDPNFKAVIPIPVGFGRLGGDGKALLLGPEINYLTQTIVAGMGMQSDMILGGLNFTGSSISLRMLENDFIQNRSQMLDLVLWAKDKIRIWLSLPDVRSVKFADFRMADDVQRNQQMIGLNASGKVSDQTMLTELGYDYEQETKKRIEEAYVQNYIADLQSKGMARSQGEAQIIQFNYQQRLQELAQKAQTEVEKRMPAMLPEAVPSGAVNAVSEFQAGGPGENPQPLAPEAPKDMMSQRIASWVTKLVQMPPEQARLSILEIKTKMPDLGVAIERGYNEQMSAPAAGPGVGPTNAGGIQPNMDPLPQQKAPRRAEML